METYTYKYNGQGQRISKRYTFTPGNQTLAEYTASIVQDFVYNVDGTLHMMTKTSTDKNGSSSTKRLVFLYDSTGVSGCMYSVNNGTPVTYYFIRDALGDISSVCNAAGRIRAEYAYDAYGNCAISGDFSNGFAEENPFRYRGYFYDTETGFYYCQTRYYNPAWGRFISMDSPDYLSPDSVAGMNLYVYCNNDPVNYVDPTGHFANFSALRSPFLSSNVPVLDKEFSWYGISGEVHAKENYFSVSNRAQFNFKKGSFEIGSFEKYSLLNLSGRLDFVQDVYNASLIFAGDICVLDSRTGIVISPEKNEFFLGVNLKAAVASARTGLQFDLFGCEAELGGSFNFWSVGINFGIEYKDGELKVGGGTALFFGWNVYIRIKFN